MENQTDAKTLIVIGGTRGWQGGAMATGHPILKKIKKFMPPQIFLSGSATAYSTNL